MAMHIQSMGQYHGGSPLDEGGLCLLSLDGAGVRGLSTLAVLRQLMQRLNSDRPKHLPPTKPCEIFELIGGTSSGGLIAIMLGRLEMDILECQQQFMKIQKTVWEGKTGDSFRNTDLERAIRQMLGERHLSPDEPFNNQKDRSCKVFVCATSQEITKPVLFKSYGEFDELGFDQPVTILQVALATCAATTFFKPIEIERRRFVHGVLGSNNPIKQMWTEALNIWCPERSDLERSVKCLVSVGSGNHGLSRIDDKNMFETMTRLATEAENTATEFISEHRGLYDDKRYFRFNVDQGLQGVGLGEYEQVGLILSATAEYLNLQEQKFKTRDCATNLKLKKDRMCSEFEVKMKGERNSRLLDAACRGKVQEIREILEDGASITATDHNGRTALHLVAAGGHIEALRLLLARGASKDTRDSAGRVPARLARDYGYSYIANMMDRGIW